MDDDDAEIIKIYLTCEDAKYGCSRWRILGRTELRIERVDQFSSPRIFVYGLKAVVSEMCRRHQRSAAELPICDNASRLWYQKRQRKSREESQELRQRQSLQKVLRKNCQCTLIIPAQGIMSM